MNLSDVKIDCFAKVVSINCTPHLKQRLLDLGLIPGTIISPVFSSALGEPIAYEFRGNIIAIRRSEAQLITVETSF